MISNNSSHDDATIIRFLIKNSFCLGHAESAPNVRSFKTGLLVRNVQLTWIGIFADVGNMKQECIPAAIKNASQKVRNIFLSFQQRALF